jgi:hypothetical protein
MTAILIFLLSSSAIIAMLTLIYLLEIRQPDRIDGKRPRS